MISLDVKSESPTAGNSANSRQIRKFAANDDRLEFKEFRADAGSSHYWTNPLHEKRPSAGDDDKLKWNFLRKDIETGTSQREEERVSPHGDGDEEDEAPLDLSIRPEVRAEPADRRRRLQTLEAERIHDISIDSGKDHI